MALGMIAVLALVALWAPDEIWSRAGTTLAYREDLSAQERLDAWRTGLNVIADRPLGGIGSGAFILAWPEYAPGDAGPARTSHNTYVQVAAETGVPSLLLFLAAIAASLLQLERAARAAPDLATPARANQVALAGFLVCSATGGLAFSWPLYLTLGVAASLPRIAASAAPIPPPLSRAT
jgi:O-antigen ligase